MRVIFCVVAVAMLIGCVSSTIEPIVEQQAVAPGILDLPVLPGSFIPDDCGVDYDVSSDGEFLGCIAFPFEEQTKGDVRFEWQYINALEAKGWSFAEGAANVLYVDRALPNTNCREKLALVAWLLGDKEEVAKYGTAREKEIDWDKIPNGVIWFMLLSEQTCED